MVIPSVVIAVFLQQCYLNKRIFNTMLYMVVYLYLKPILYRVCGIWVFTESKYFKTCRSKFMIGQILQEKKEYRVQKNFPWLVHSEILLASGAGISMVYQPIAFQWKMESLSGGCHWMLFLVKKFNSIQRSFQYGQNWTSLFKQ